MRFSSLRYLIREGFRNIWQNLFMAIASIGVLISCLLLTGGSYLIFENINKIFDWIHEQNVVVAYASADCTDTQALYDKIAGISNVEKVEFLSKEDALVKYKDSIPEAVYADMQGENNPFPDSYVISFYDLSLFDDTIVQLQQIPEINDMSYDPETAAKLTRIQQVVLAVGGGIIGMLLLVSLFIIANTIKLTVYSRRLEISIMKSVGATNAFVRIPFIIEGVVLGIVAGGLAYGIIYFAYDLLSDMLTNMIQFGALTGMVAFSSVWWKVLLGFMAIGIITGVSGSAISIRKYLKDKGGTSGVI